MPARSGPRITDVMAYLAGVVLAAGALTVLWRSMRAVMDIGGTCASGGPYEVAVPCPQGVGWLLPVAMLVGVAGVGMVATFGSRIGPGLGALALLAWPALFLSLGWNFLEYAFASPGGWDLSWLVCGVLFVAMGGVPLVVGLRGRWASRAAATGRPGPTPRDAGGASDEARTGSHGGTSRHAQLAVLLREARDRAAAQATSTSVGGPATADDAPSGMVEQLERLARLRSEGSLGDAEYLQATRAVIDAASKGRVA